MTAPASPSSILGGAPPADPPGGGGAATPPATLPATPPGTTPATTPPATPPAPPAAPEHWADPFVADDGLRGFVKSRSWENGDALVKSYRDLEALRGIPADRLLTLPEKADDKAAWTAVHRRLGAPEAADGYELPSLDLPAGAVDLSPAFRTKALELGLSKAQAKSLFEWYGEQGTAAVNEAGQKFEEQRAVAARELRTEWGREYEVNMLAADRAAERRGLTEDQLRSWAMAWGPKAVLEFLAPFGRAMGELQLGREPDDQGVSAAGMTPSEGRRQFRELTGDRAFMQKVIDNPTGPEAAKYERLSKIAAGS